MGMNEVIRQSHGNAFCTMHDIYYLSLSSEKKNGSIMNKQISLLYAIEREKMRHDELFNSVFSITTPKVS